VYVQEVRWEKGGMVRRGDYICFYQKGIGFCIHHRIVSAHRRVQFVSDRVPHIVLRGRWSNIIVLYVHAPSEEKCDDSEGSF